MNIKTVIVDDEDIARRRIIKLLADFTGIDVIGEADNGHDAVEIIDARKPDLVFLDIQMPGMTGLQVAQNIHHRPVIVFITAYDEFALKAFEVNAIDYLLKPVSKAKIQKVVEKVLPFIEQSHGDTDKVEKLFDYMRDSHSFLERISVRNKHEYIVVNVEDIDFFKMEDHLLFLYSNGEKYLIDFTLKKLEEKLDPDVFFRAHRKAIVNLSKIRRVITWGRGNYTLRFESGENVYLSREKINKFKSLMGF